MAGMPWAFLTTAGGICEFFFHKAAKNAYPSMLLFWYIAVKYTEGLWHMCRKMMAFQ